MSTPVDPLLEALAAARDARASRFAVNDQLCVRSASLRGLAVNDKSNAGTLHDAADLLYDASAEIGYLRNSHGQLLAALRDLVLCVDPYKSPQAREYVANATAAINAAESEGA